MPAIAERLFTEEEYLELEDKNEERHEYVDGVLRLMAGTTQKHNDIVQNFVLKLTLLARSKGCRLAVENIRVKLPVGSKRNYYYPDVVLSCNLNDTNSRTIIHPCFVVEVLSKSTAEVDRVEKLETYQRIASIKQYTLVDQTRRKIEMYTRQDSVWIYQLLEEGIFNVACLDTTMTLGEVYAGLTFDNTESELSE